MMTPSTPAPARAHVYGTPCVRCAGLTADGKRCRVLVRPELGAVCGKHVDRGLPRELAVLRDPRTSEPAEVG